MGRGKVVVSVIIPTYKRSQLLVRAVDSVLNQTFKRIEVIVVDDNDSTSNYRNITEQIMSRYKDDLRVTYIKHDKNRNGSVARNTGIIASRGNFISFLDDDDYYLPDKTLKLVSALENNQTFAGAYCGWKRGDEVYKPVNDNELIKNLLLGRSFVYTPTTLLEREAVLSIHGWNEKILRHQDSEFIIRFLSEGYKLLPIEEVLVVIDETDRTQMPIGLKWEQSTNQFLDIMQEHIEKIDAVDRGFKCQVYCNRYLSIMLNYFKNMFLLRGIYIYISAMMQYPLRFNKTIFNYLNKRFKRKS